MFPFLTFIHWIAFSIFPFLIFLWRIGHHRSVPTLKKCSTCGTLHYISSMLKSTYVWHYVTLVYFTSYWCHVNVIHAQSIFNHIVRVSSFFSVCLKTELLKTLRNFSLQFLCFSVFFARTGNRTEETLKNL